MFCISYVGMAFVFLFYEKYDRMHQNYGYCLHFAVPIGILIASLLPKQPK